MIEQPENIDSKFVTFEVSKLDISNEISEEQPANKYSILLISIVLKVYKSNEIKDEHS